MSTHLPPPPPGYSEIPEPPQVALPPPPVEEVTEVHESDVLKRQGKFSWKNFGGDGFMISLAVHIILAVLGLFWVVSSYVAEKAKGDPEVFATGSGGGANGDKAKQFETKLKSRNMQVKMPSRIVSKNANASVSLPSTPNTSTASFATGLSSGGMSKGSGGGSGGGEGTGIGVGKGGGRNLVTLFGAVGANAPGLPGSFYDCKQTQEGKASPYAEGGPGNTMFADQVLRTFLRTFDEAKLKSKFFRAPDQLALQQLLVPHGPADAAPKAYGVQDKCKASRWMAVYRGLITAPKTGKFRFWGLGDDSLVVRVNGKLVLDSGWLVLTEKGDANTGNHGVPKFNGQTALLKTSFAAPFRAGPWIDFTKGRDAEIELFISEIPGGGFCAYLFMEEAGSDGKGDGNIFLFRLTDEPLPDGVKDTGGVNVDLSGKGLCWRGRASKTNRSVR